jgi:hypothetical protein
MDKIRGISFVIGCCSVICFGGVLEGGQTGIDGWPKIEKYENKTYFDNASSYWKDSMECLVHQGAIIITDEQETKSLKDFALMMNRLIKNKDSSEFSKYIHGDLKWYGIPCERKTNQEGKVFVKTKDLVGGKGSVYERIFDYKQFWSRNKSDLTSGNQLIDVKTYLQLYENWVSWRFLYFKNSDEYEVWFSIPDNLIDQLGWFHFRVKKIDGRFWIKGI